MTANWQYQCPVTERRFKIKKNYIAHLKKIVRNKRDVVSEYNRVRDNLIAKLKRVECVDDIIPIINDPVNEMALLGYLAHECRFGRYGNASFRCDMRDLNEIKTRAKTTTFNTNWRSRCRWEFHKTTGIGYSSHPRNRHPFRWSSSSTEKECYDSYYSQITFRVANQDFMRNNWGGALSCIGIHTCGGGGGGGTYNYSVRLFLLDYPFMYKVTQKCKQTEMKWKEEDRINNTFKRLSGEREFWRWYKMPVLTRAYLHSKSCAESETPL